MHWTCEEDLSNANLKLIPSASLDDSHMISNLCALPPLCSKLVVSRFLFPFRCWVLRVHSILNGSDRLCGVELDHGGRRMTWRRGHVSNTDDSISSFVFSIGFPNPWASQGPRSLSLDIFELSYQVYLISHPDYGDWNWESTPTVLFREHAVRERSTSLAGKDVLVGSAAE